MKVTKEMDGTNVVKPHDLRISTCITRCKKGIYDTSGNDSNREESSFNCNVLNRKKWGNEKCCTYYF